MRVAEPGSMAKALKSMKRQPFVVMSETDRFRTPVCAIEGGGSRRYRRTASSLLRYDRNQSELDVRKSIWTVFGSSGH